MRLLSVSNARTPAVPDARAVSEALAVLQIDRLALGIHRSAFPPGPFDAGYGSPASQGGTRLLELARGLGFSALQLGPAGAISDENPSPYDATAFARSLRSLDLESLCEANGFGLLSHDEALTMIDAAGAQPSRADPARAGRVVAWALSRAQARLSSLRAEQSDHPAVLALHAFRERERAWLELDVVFEAVAKRVGHDDPARFEPAVGALFDHSSAGRQRRQALRSTLAADIERAELGQLLAQRQAALFRERAHERGLRLLGDLQVGWSTRDRFLRAAAFADGWLLGAPPSHTNPEGQPWGYPLLDPDQLDDPHSPARRLLRLRLARELAAHDGLRVDHPHGLVCPWIYRAGEDDPLRAVQQGTRAFASPDLGDATLRRWAIARTDDLALDAESRWADRWVQRLDEDQVARYARLLDDVVEVAREHGHGVEAIAVEVLSTCPTALARVLSRHGLGRFRVTQKANPDDPHDVYRTDRAQPADWVMLGNHDTPPILAVAERWRQDGSAEARARYLAARLVRAEPARGAAVARFCASPHALAEAHLADLFLSGARNVLIYFTDLFGESEPLNRAGVVHSDNWSLRLPADPQRLYQERALEGRALDPTAALAMALSARGARDDLVSALAAGASG